MPVPTWIFAVPRKLRHHAHLKKLPIPDPSRAHEAALDLVTQNSVLLSEQLPCLLQPLQTAEQMETVAPYPGTCPSVMATQRQRLP